MKKKTLDVSFHLQSLGKWVEHREAPAQWQQTVAMGKATEELSGSITQAVMIKN